jgi:hypothetical protein
LRTWVTIRAITGHVEAEINWEMGKGRAKKGEGKREKT